MSLSRLICALLLTAATMVSMAAAREMGPLTRPRLVEDGTTARVIVKYRADSALRRPQSGRLPSPQHAAVLGQRLGLALRDRWVLGTHVQSLGADGITADELARRIAAMPDVEWAEPVRRKVAMGTVPNDPLYPNHLSGVTPAAGQWYLRAPDSTFVSAIDAVGAWATTTGAPTVTVAVIDTGVLFGHPDFTKLDGSSKLYAGYDFISRTSNSNDGDGVDADATDPGDWSSASSSCGASPSSWHGTQTASLIGAATDNGIGMAGVGRDVMILPVRVLGLCGGYDDDIQAGMLWAAGLSSSPTANPHPAQVINMSLGGTGSCSASYQSVVSRLVQAGVVLVVSAGNDEGLAVSMPANCSGAIAVAGVRNVGTKVGYSSLGPQVALSAPAGNCINTSGACLYPIITATNAGTTSATGFSYSDSTNYAVGTSFSAPMVAGAAALMLSVDPTLKPADVTALLKSSARAFPSTGGTAGISTCHAPNSSAQDECYCSTSTCGAGLLDVAAAVAAAAGSVPAPTVSVSASSRAPAIGEIVTLTGAGSASGGRSIAGYQWSISDGAALAAFSGATNAASATLVGSAAGSVTVQLTVTDSAGASASSTLTLAVQGLASGTSSGSGGAVTASSSGGGGGALSAGWLALLALAVLALRAPSRRPRTAPRSAAA